MSAHKNGIWPRIHRDAYDRIERVNFSTLKAMARSPAHYAQRMVAEAKDTDAKKLGRAVHIAVFEPERFRSACAVWDGGTRRGKDWDKFVDVNEGRELLTVAEHEKCVAIQKAVRGDATAAKYVTGGQGEVTLLWDHAVGDGANAYQIGCKGRIDFDHPAAIVDLKITRDASPEGFGRQVWSYRYDAQAAWYGDAYVRAGGAAKPYVLIAAENEAPFVVQVYRVPVAVIELGREAYSAWMDRLALCRETSTWPAYADAELDLELPRWAMPSDEDLSELGLITGDGEAA